MGTTTPTREEQVQADQEAMEEARAEMAEEAETSHEEVVEERGGQLAAFAEPKFSGSAGGPPPSSGEVRLAGGKYDWDHDMLRGDEFVALVRYKAGAPTIGDVKSWPCGIVDFATFSAEMAPSEAVRAVADLRTRASRDRAAIDQCAQLAESLIDDDGILTGPEVAERIRELMYERFEINDSAYEVTHGTPDHQEPEGDTEADNPEDKSEAEIPAPTADAGDPGPSLADTEPAEAD